MTSLARTLAGFGAWRLSRNRFQPFNHTLPDRYPWLFSFVRETLGDGPDRRLLSFGCSVGEEAFALRRYFPDASIRGIDIDPRNIAKCRDRAREIGVANCDFAVGDSTSLEAPQSYDAIFCLAVLCNGRLTVSGAERCDPILRFAIFERQVTDFARCLKDGGLLCLLSTNFRFCDTSISANFDTVLSVEGDRLSPDVLFGRDNRLMRGVVYPDVVFRKQEIGPLPRNHIEREIRSYAPRNSPARRPDSNCC